MLGQEALFIKAPPENEFNGNLRLIPELTASP